MDITTATWLLRAAAAQWLREHPDDLNAPSVRKAIESTEALAGMAKDREQAGPR